MMRKFGVMAFYILIALLAMAYSQASRTFTTGRIAISHDGNCFDNDDIGASAFDWGIIAAFGMQKRLVHFEHSDNLSCDVASQDADMTLSATAWKYFPGFDSSVVFDCKQRLSASIANFKKQAELSSANDRLYFICCGPMETPWQCINAVAAASRKFITCISHSSWNDDFTSGTTCTHTWSSMRTSFSADGVVFTHISDQNVNVGGGSNWSFLSSMPTNTSIPASAWTWMQSRDKKSGDVSDCGMTWFLMTGMQNGTPADFSARFKSPLPMELPTAVNALITMSSINKTVSATVHQNGKILKVLAEGMNDCGPVIVFNLFGRVVSQGTMIDGLAELDIGLQPSGTYLMKIKSNDTSIMQRILLK
jgi:hypothetical protein